MKRPSYSHTIKLGRLGNQIIRDIAFSRLAFKHNLLISYSSQKQCEQLGIPLFCGDRCFDNKYICVNDLNYFDLLQTSTINANITCDNTFLQSELITTLIRDFLYENRQSIMESNPFIDRYKSNNDAYVHIRIGDIEQYTLPIQYYIDCLHRFQFDTLYISTDSPDHRILREMKARYPNMELISYDEIRTIQFASTCKQIVLSHGTFSGIIGYLAFFSNIYYSGKTPGWCPLDICTGKGWNEILSQ